MNKKFEIRSLFNFLLVFCFYSLVMNVTVMADIPSYSVPKNFRLGTMGGMLTLSELENTMDSMTALFPVLVSKKVEIGKTITNRSIYAIRISNHPNVDQNKPKAYYDGLIHAREPMSMMSLVYFMWYVLENYAVDPNIKAIVDNIEMHFVLCVNPDGYEYNRSTNPGGGGMWRKNRSVNSDGSHGVDIDRNFSTKWGDVIGPPPNPESDSYPGIRAFSERESQALKDYHLAKKFTIMVNYHSYGNSIVFPSGVDTNLAEYKWIRKNLIPTSGLLMLPPLDTNYITPGSEIEWVYKTLKTFAFEIHLGSSSDGFWPTSNRIVLLAEGARDLNLVIAKTILSPIVPLQRVYKQLASNFHTTFTNKNGQFQMDYRLSDSPKTWYLAVHDIQGKQYKQVKLNPGGNTLSLSSSETPGPMFILQVKSCAGANCNTVYQEKVLTSGF